MNEKIKVGAGQTTFLRANGPPSTHILTYTLYSTVGLARARPNHMYRLTEVTQYYMLKI